MNKATQQMVEIEAERIYQIKADYYQLGKKAKKEMKSEKEVKRKGIKQKPRLPGVT